MLNTLRKLLGNRTKYRRPILIVCADKTLQAGDKSSSRITKHMLERTIKVLNKALIRHVDEEQAERRRFDKELGAKNESFKGGRKKSAPGPQKEEKRRKED